MHDPLLLTLEFARFEDAEDPHAELFGAQDYHLRREGGGYRQASLLWKRDFRELLAAVRLPDRDPADVARLGELLRGFLEGADWETTEAEIEAAVAQGRPVLITVVSAAAELYRLPWELTRLRVRGQPLGELPGVQFRHCWPEVLPTPETPAPRLETGRVLVAWSAAAGRVPAGPHVDAIGAACRQACLDFVPERDVLEHATLDDIVAALDDETAPPVSVLHLLAHGGAVGTTHGLVLDDGQGGRSAVDAGRLRAALAPHLGHLRLVLIAACDSGNAGPEGNVLGSVAQALHRAGLAAVVASRFPLSVHGSTVLTEQLYAALLGRPASLEDALAEARSALRAVPEHLDWASVVLYTHPVSGHDTRPVVFRPYQGLLAFPPERARFFFGRDGERQEIAEDLAALVEGGHPRFLVVAGASGTGKSSVVMAGAVPDLTARPERGAVRDDAELQQLTQRLDALVARYNAPTVRDAAARLRAFAAQVDARVETHWARFCPGEDPLGALDQALRGRRDDAPFLLVVDQFEEVFTHVDDPGVRQQFCQRLWALAQGTTDISVICTLRVDFLGECGQIVLDAGGTRLDTVAYDESHRVFVAKMRTAQLVECIEAPARAVGLRLEAGLVQTLAGELKTEPGALPLLSHVMDQLWQRRTADGRLTLEEYHALGGVGGCLEREADAVVALVDEAGLRQLRRLMPRLVSAATGGAARTRRRVRRDELCPTEEADRVAFLGVLRTMVDRRLIVEGESAGHATLEVAHEALIRRWSRLHRWLEDSDELLEALESLEASLVAWREHRSPLIGAQLAFAEGVLEKYPGEVGEEMRTLIARSREEAAMETSSWFFVLLVFLGGFSSFLLGRVAWEEALLLVLGAMP